MNLTIKERIVLLASLPAQSDIASIRILRQLKERLAFTEGEWQEYGLAIEDDNYRWKVEYADTEVDIEMGKRAEQLVAEALRELDRKKTLTDDHISLWDKFIGEGE